MNINIYIQSNLVSLIFMSITSAFVAPLTSSIYSLLISNTELIHKELDSRYGRGLFWVYLTAFIYPGYGIE